jgi:signal peptidase II
MFKGLSINPSMAKYLIFGVIVIILDVATKSWASKNLISHHVELLPILDFHLAHNYGAAFSFLSDQGGWQRWFFIIISSSVCLVLVIYVLLLKSSERWLAVAFSIIFGGGAGNLIDRVQLGYVVDFISVHYSVYYFPTFNVADMAITFGAMMLLYDMVFIKHESK